jgi:hypothetical protein
VGWAWLYGARATTVSWLDCCGVTGDASGVSISVSGDGNRSVLVSQWQQWVPTGRFPGRVGNSVHNFTLRWDPRFGYVVDASLVLRIDNHTLAGRPAVEFLNFLTPQLIQPWPAGLRTGGAGVPAAQWPASHTAYANDAAGQAWTGFALNILAGAELHQYAMPSGTLGGTLVLAPGGYSAGIAYASATGLAQATCPTWADQHQLVPVATAAEGGPAEVTLAPSFSILWAPPALGAYVLGRMTDVHAQNASAPPPYPRWTASNMLRLGVTETFLDQPVPLTEPLRALSTGRPPAPDLNVVAPSPGTAALRVDAMAAGDASQPYAFALAQP